eukprot:TRINITY_DN27537_c0_g1_i1.p1 TRINITY_DN27537_c0_g1~~TRINITY_DN27537_c0_g1_i1.p1  ORF type:complete len:1288 (+),score=313.63 TRINITY_DN27537_c0_g1_i1:78-3941(+)
MEAIEEFTSDPEKEEEDVSARGASPKCRGTSRQGVLAGSREVGCRPGGEGSAASTDIDQASGEEGEEERRENQAEAIGWRPSSLTMAAEALVRRRSSMASTFRAYDTLRREACSASEVQENEAALAAAAAQPSRSSASGVASAPAVDSRPAGTGDLPASEETLQKLTILQLQRLLRSKKGKGQQPPCANPKKADFVKAALESGCSNAEAEAFSSSIQSLTTAGVSSNGGNNAASASAAAAAKVAAPKPVWSAARRELFNKAQPCPDMQSMLRYIHNMLHVADPEGLKPTVSCLHCGAPGCELIDSGTHEPFVGCISYHSDKPCKRRTNVDRMFRHLLDRSTVFLEVVSDKLFEVRLHKDLAVLREYLPPTVHSAAPSVSVATLAGGRDGGMPDRVSLTFALQDHDRVVNALRSLPQGLMVRLRDIPQKTLQALQTAAAEDDRFSSMASVQNLARRRLEDRGLLELLRPHQLQFVDWAVHRRRVLCADDMGLGKSLQALSLLVALDALPALIVCPAFARGSWAAQIEQWGFASPGEYNVVQGGSSCLPNKAGSGERIQLAVVSYRMLQREFKSISGKVQWKGFVVDESHRIGTSKKTEDDVAEPVSTKAGDPEARAVLQLLRQHPDSALVCLTGTPAWTHSFDIFNQIELLKPGLLGRTKWDFAREYFRVRRERIHRGSSKVTMQICECERPIEVNMVLTRTVMLRRRRREVLQDLPALQLVETPLDIEDKHVSQAVRTYSISRTSDGSWDGVLTDWERVGLCKVEAAIEVLKEKLLAATSEGEVAIVFVRHHRVREALEKYLEDVLPDLRLASMYGAHRDEVLRRFQAGCCDVVICLVESCGVAIDLCRASLCVFVELPSSWSEFEQAVARLHRQGQRSAVTAYVLLGGLSKESREARRGGASASAVDGSSAQAPAVVEGDILKECGGFDRKRWRTLLSQRREAAKMLGDPSPGEKASSQVAVLAPAAGASLWKQPSEEAALRGGCGGWKFLVSSETHRLHVYDQQGKHSGFLSRTGVVLDAEITLDADDFSVVGRSNSSISPTGGACASDVMVSAANDYLLAFAQLNAIDRGAIQRHTGADGRPVPLAAVGLEEMAKALRGHKAPSTRRFKAPASTQQAAEAAQAGGAGGAGTTAWVRAIVETSRGPSTYRQRIDLATKRRYCVACFAELEGAEVTLEEEDDPNAKEEFSLRCSSVTELFCTGQCKQNYFVKTKSGAARSALFALEGGICRDCKVDTADLRRKLQRLKLEERSGYQLLGNMAGRRLLRPVNKVRWLAFSEGGFCVL